MYETTHKKEISAASSDVPCTILRHLWRLGWGIERRWGKQRGLSAMQQQKNAHPELETNSNACGFFGYKKLR
jgi:hypothetical protein